MTSYFWALVGLGVVFFALNIYPDLGDSPYVSPPREESPVPSWCCTGSCDHCVWEGKDRRGPLVPIQQNPLLLSGECGAKDTLYSDLAPGKLLDSGHREGPARVVLSGLYMQPGLALLLCSEVHFAFSIASYSCPRAFALPVFSVLYIFLSCRAIPMSDGTGLVAAMTGSRIAGT